MTVIVPNSLHDAINAKLDAAIAEVPDADARKLLAYAEKVKEGRWTASIDGADLNLLIDALRHLVDPWRDMSTAPPYSSRWLVCNDRGVYAADWMQAGSADNVYSDGWYVEDGKRDYRMLRGSTPHLFAPLPPPPREER